MLNFSLFEDYDNGGNAGSDVNPIVPHGLYGPILPPGYYPGDREPFEVDPLIGPPAMACNCLHGTAWIDASGNCRCDNEPQVWIDPATGKKKIIPSGMRREPMPRQPQTGNVTPTATTPTAAAAAATDEPFTILGLNPLVALGIAAGGIFLIASMSGETKPTKGGTTI